MSFRPDLPTATPAPESITEAPTQTDTRDNPLLHRAKIIRDITETKERLARLGLARYEEEVLSRGCTTDQPDVLRLFQRKAELQSAKTVNVNIGRDFTINAAVKLINDQLGIVDYDGKNPWEHLRTLLSTKQIKQITLNIDPDVNPLELPRELEIFSGLVRGCIQHEDLPTVAFSTNLKAIPYEIGRNLRTVTPIKQSRG